MARDTIETGTEQDSDAADAIPGTENPDVCAFADDGEYATVWGVSRIDDTTVLVDYVRCEAGASEYDSPTEQHTIDADKTTEQFARELSQADPEEAVNLAREHFEDN